VLLVAFVRLHCAISLLVSRFAPGALKRLYTYIALVELDSAVIAHPACYDSYPFAKELQFFLGSLMLTAATFVFVRVQERESLMKRVPAVFRKAIALGARLLLTLMVVTYPLIANMALKMLNCTSLDGSYVLSASTGFKCYQSDHLAVGLLAWPVLLLHVAGFPIVTLVYLRRWVMSIRVSTWLLYRVGVLVSFCVACV
jgi:hypothetical protein